MTEKDSKTTESASTPPDALASEGEAGRWIQDPDDPEFEVWEPWDAATVERPGVGEEWGSDADLSKKVVVWNDGRGPRRACRARRTSGEPCQRAAVTGADVCATHGGRAPQVKAKARVRLEMAADRLARELLGIATGADVADSVRLAATKDALDRAGLSAKTAVEVEVGPSKGFEQILGAVLQGGSRAASRAARGEPDDGHSLNDGPDDDWAASEVLDAQVVEDYEVLPPTPRPTQTEHPASAPRGSAQRSVSGQSAAQSSGSGFMDLEDALDTLHRTAPPPAAPAPRRHSR